MSYEKKFKAAVNVIRNLPKNGAYQPSHELMLRFYAYYKQATEGPNKMPKPNFWELVKKAKWDAWSKLGNMTKEEAMMNYVEELNKIVETMSFTDNVADFLTSLDSLYDNVPVEDLHMLVGPVIERVSSQPGSPLSGSPLGSREASPQRLRLISRDISENSSYSASPLPPESDDDDDFVDTIEVEEMDKNPKKKASNVAVQPSGINPTKTSVTASAINGVTNIRKEKEYSPKPKESEMIKSPQVPSNSCQCGHTSEDIDAIMKQATTKMRQDYDTLTERVSSLELKLYKKELERKQKENESMWLSFTGLSTQAIAFIILWPFLVTLILQSVQRRKS